MGSDYGIRIGEGVIIWITKAGGVDNPKLHVDAPSLIPVNRSRLSPKNPLKIKRLVHLFRQKLAAHMK